MKDSNWLTRLFALGSGKPKAPRKSASRRMNRLRTYRTEVLEVRSLLAVTQLTGGLLSVTFESTDSNAAIVGDVATDQLVVFVDGVVAGSFSLSAISSLMLNGNDLDNQIDLSGIPQFTIANVTVNTYGGNDVVTGSMGSDFIDLGSGNDIAFGGGGMDTIIGGAGDDILGGNSSGDSLTGGDGADSLYGQQGIDTLNGGAGDDLIDLGGDQANLPPIFVSSPTLTLSDAAENGDIVATVIAIDPEGGTLTYQLIDPTGTFAIDSSSGVITVANADNIGIDDSTSWTFAPTVVVSDGTNTVSQDVTIDVAVVVPDPNYEITEPIKIPAVQLARTDDMVVKATREAGRTVIIHLFKIVNGRTIGVRAVTITGLEQGGGNEVTHNFGKGDVGDYEIKYYRPGKGSPIDSVRFSVR